MKSFFLIFILATGLAFNISAQTNNAILFSENGERFKVVVNGIQQNSKTETNVKITGLTASFYKCRILFADKGMGYLDFNMNFPEMGSEVTWNIKKNKKGEYVTRWVSSIPIASAPTPAPSQTIVVYSLTPAVEKTTTTTYQQTTSTTDNGYPGDNININIGMNPNNGSSSVNFNSAGQTTSSQTITTTTTTTTAVHDNDGDRDHHRRGGDEPEHHERSYVPGYTGPIGCPRPTSEGEFSSMKESIQSKSFESTQLTIAKQVLNNHCLTSSQVKEIMQIFSFESTRLDYAKYAYGYTYDIGNYYKVNDAFQFESSIDDLNKYISGKKK